MQATENKVRFLRTYLDDKLHMDEFWRLAAFFQKIDLQRL